MSDKLRYGCIGAGGIARWKHVKGYSETADVELTAICDSDLKAAEEVAKEYGISQVYSDYNEMLEKSKLDFVSICTPNYLHAPAAVKALEKGLHVHCEKPLAINAAEAQKIVDAKNKYGRKVMVALNNRFTNESYFIKKYAEEGYLGKIYHAKCGWRRRRGIPGKGGWFTNKKLSGGGPLIDLGVHFMDLVMYFMGFPSPVSVSGETYSKFAGNSSLNGGSYGNSGNGVYDVEDLAVGLVRLENGSTIDFEFSWASNIENDYNYYEILGTKGGAAFRDDKLKIFSEIQDTCVDITPRTDYPKKVLNEFTHFTDCIKNGSEPIAPPEEAVKLMKIIDGTYKSARTKNEVTLRL